MSDRIMVMHGGSQTELLILRKQPGKIMTLATGIAMHRNKYSKKRCKYGNYPTTGTSLQNLITKWLRQIYRLLRLL